MHGNLLNFSKRLSHHLHYVKLTHNLNSVHFLCGLNALCRLTAILSGADGKWGLWVSSGTLPASQASPEAFLAWTYTVKSPVIKQLEGPLWGDLVQCGRCQSDCNQDLHRPGSWWHSATLTWAYARRLIAVIHAVSCTALTLCHRLGMQESIREGMCALKHIPWHLAFCCV